MSKQYGPAVPTSTGSRFSLFLTNLRLLDLDKYDEFSEFSAQLFSGKDALQNQKQRIHCVEWALFRLYEIFDSEETKDKLKPFFPTLEPLQSLNLRAALFRCLSELKRNGTLGKDVMIRKSLFDDCKGEKLQELLLAFSTVVLRKVLAGNKTEFMSIAEKLSLAERIPSGEHASLLPLAVAHRASLTALLRRKRDRKMRFKEFRGILNLKEKELDYRFDKIIQTQDILDKNVVSEHTVARIGKQLDTHWQGDQRWIAVIAKGEDHELHDLLLEKPFTVVWPQVGAGTFDGDTSTSRKGLLEDLEGRVAAQEARLKDWRDFKEMQRNRKPTTSPRNVNIKSPQIRNVPPSMKKAKDLVFSPRKSPRKSIWPTESFAEGATPTMMPMSPGIDETPSKIRTAPEKSHIEIVTSPSIRNRNLSSRAAVSLKNTDDHDSSLSELVGDHTAAVQGTSRSHSLEHGPPLSSGGFEKIKLESLIADNPEASGSRGINAIRPPTSTDISWSPIETIRDHPTPPSPPAAKQSHPRQSEPPSPDPDDLLAQQIISLTLNAAPTPSKPPLTLLERTRQSMALASPIPHNPSNTSIFPPVPTQSKNTQPCHRPPTTTQTLLERTRQSISLVPPPKPHRKSLTHIRRGSKIYPTNQFETPRKQVTIDRLTPPEELWAEGAEYESVFKSRPKIGFSPRASPEPSAGEDVDVNYLQESEDGVGWEHSPLARRGREV